MPTGGTLINMSAQGGSATSSDGIQGAPLPGVQGQGARDVQPMSVEHIGHFKSGTHRSGFFVELIEWGKRWSPSGLGNMEVDHGRLDKRMTEKLFDGNNVETVFK